MNLKDAINVRRSIRRYLDVAIEEEKVAKLQEIIDELNKSLDLHIQLVLNDKAVSERDGKPKYGAFANAYNYVVLAGKRCRNLNEKLGYAGECIALNACLLGLGTCFVGMSYTNNKDKYVLNKGESLDLVLYIGYPDGTTKPSRTSKTYDDVAKGENVPDWFKEGVEAALKAPTALNQQKFKLEYKNDKVKASVSGIGVFTKTDLGIVKYNFEIGSGKDSSIWAD